MCPSIVLGSEGLVAFPASRVHQRQLCVCVCVCVGEGGDVTRVPSAVMPYNYKEMSLPGCTRCSSIQCTY